MIMKAIQRIRDNTVLSLVLAILGAALYSVQAWVYAHIQTSFVDEGGYLYIGDLFLRGILRPFQDFGPPRWYSPLSYLIPGQIEMWFGTSLLTGRFF
jgi:surface polysaccharide O-acyltransferase-like enzyme